MWHARLLVWVEKVCGWHMNKKPRNWELGIQGHEVNDFSRSPLRLLCPSLPFGPFGIVLEDNPCFLSECPMFSHQYHYLLTTCWNGKQGWPVSVCVCVGGADLHLRPPAEMKALAACDWREKCEREFALYKFRSFVRSSQKVRTKE